MTSLRSMITSLTKTAMVTIARSVPGCCQPSWHRWHGLPTMGWLRTGGGEREREREREREGERERERERGREREREGEGEGEGERERERERTVKFTHNYAFSIRTYYQQHCTHRHRFQTQESP